MSGHQHEPPSYEELCRHLEAVPTAVRQLEQVLARNAIPGSWLRMKFDANHPLYLDDKGPNALALAVYNPNAFAVAIGTGGTSAAADSFPVPAQKLVVAPLQVNGPAEFLADVEGEEKGFVWRVRFQTPQPFFVGDL